MTSSVAVADAVPAGSEELQKIVYKKLCETSHLGFTRYFFKSRQQNKFRINWHHHLISDAIEDVIEGKIENLVINVPPGSSKTEMVVINLIARGLAKNPRSRFLHISYSDDLALLNSSTARDLIRSEEFQEFWPMAIAPDSKAKNRWNVMVDGKPAGGVYAVSLSGQITGFRAGHMAPGFQGAILIDDPVKPEDAFSKPRMDRTNRQMLTTIKSRKANPKTPIILIMQRVGDNDPTQFILDGNIPGKWTHIKIPAVMDADYIATLAPKYQAMIEKEIADELGRVSYWEYKEPITELGELESGSGTDQQGNRVSRHVFAGQYMQAPVAIGGNCIRSEWFPKYTVLPRLKYRKIYADTAQKTKEHNDYTVFQCWGHGVDGKIYLLDQVRGKWEAPELKKQAIMFWQKHNSVTDTTMMGSLRAFMVEDASSGTGLIQELKLHPYNIPIKAIERVYKDTHKQMDKLTRVMDAQPYMEAGMVCVPLNAPFTSDLMAESEAFLPDGSHAHDDQIDPMVDAVKDMLSNENKLNVWEALADKR